VPKTSNGAHRRWAQLSDLVVLSRELTATNRTAMSRERPIQVGLLAGGSRPQPANRTCAPKRSSRGISAALMQKRKPRHAGGVVFALREQSFSLPSAREAESGETEAE